MSCHHIYSLILFFAAGCSNNQQRNLPKQQPEGHDIPQSGAIVIPVANEEGLSPNQIGRSSVSIIPAQGEEPAQGPNSFDVRDNGTIAISDPLRLGITNFSVEQGPGGPKAIFSSFAALKAPIQLLGTQVDRQYSVRDLLTGQFAEITTRPVSSITEIPSKPPATVAPKPLPQAANPVNPTKVAASAVDVRTVIASDSSGSVQYTLHNLPTTIQVQLSLPGWRIASLDLLGTDGAANAYVLCEATPIVFPGTIQVKRVIWKYSPAGGLLGTIANVPSQGIIAPSTEFRLVNGTIYQMVVTNTDVRINEWNTASIR